MRTRSHGPVRLLALLAALAMVLAACGGNGDADTTTTTAAATTTTAASGDTTTTTAPDEGDATGGTLRVGVRDDVQRWDSSRLQGVLFPFHRNLYDTLADYVDGLNAQPMLATGWEISDAQDSVTITLREGVLFHSGREMTAEDIAANLAYFIDPETGNQVFGPTDGAVQDWEVTGPYEIVVNFKQPIAELQITDLLTSWAIGDPEFFDSYDTQAQGTGPFKFVQWTPGESVTLEAHTEYWGDGPYVDTIEYRIFGDADAMVSALEAGDIDVLYSPRALDASRLEGQGYTVVVAPAGAIIDQLRLQPVGQPPLDNIDIRMMLNYATDMVSINEAIYGGLGTPLRLPYAPTSPAYDQALASSLEYDLDKAREHLEASGLPESEWTATIMTSSASTEAQLVSQILQQALAQIGFTLEIDLQDAATASDRYFNGDYQIYWSGIGNAQKYPTRISTNSIYRHTGNPIFDMEATFPDYTAAINAANAAVTAEEQAATFAELNRSIVDNMFVVSGIARPMLALTAPNITGAYKDIDAQERYHLVRIEN
ncbi:MAG TPA: ABC transporter substrate-binding protein [Acidimicrobiia bacterium]|nr:ABC transporter substrate-binding protein [Acidimicrobiia bacterium]